MKLSNEITNNIIYNEFEEYLKKYLRIKSFPKMYKTYVHSGRLYIYLNKRNFLFIGKHNNFIVEYKDKIFYLPGTYVKDPVPENLVYNGNLTIKDMKELIKNEIIL